jgi:uncharacterized protein (TIGR02117 family)
MHIVRKTLQYLLRLLGILIGAILLYGLIALIGGLLPTSPGKRDCESTQQVYIASNGLHLDIIFPRAYLDSTWISDLLTPAQTEYVAFGWGDRAFYVETPTWDEFRLSVGLKAVFVNSATAMHVTRYEGARSDWRTLQLCTAQVDTLMKYVQNSFARNGDRELVSIEAPGYPVRDQFYEARGDYSFLKTCNNWVNIGLKRAGVRTAIWAPFDWGVLWYVEN